MNHEYMTERAETMAAMRGLQTKPKDLARPEPAERFSSSDRRRGSVIGLVDGVKNAHAIPPGAAQTFAARALSDFDPENVFVPATLAARCELEWVLVDGKSFLPRPVSALHFCEDPSLLDPPLERLALDLPFCPAGCEITLVFRNTSGEPLTLFPCVIGRAGALPGRA